MGSDDIGWQHGVMLENRHNFKCNYCDFTGQEGRVSRLKKYLAGGRLTGYHDVQGCKMVPREVKKLMIEHLKHVRAETARKRADKEMQERIISGRERDEDIEDEVKMYAEYVPDPDVRERQARAQSRAEAWEGDQWAAHRVSFHGAQHEVGSGSGSGSGSTVGGAGGTQSRRFSNVGDYFTRPPPTQTQLPEQRRHSKRPTGVQIEDVDPYVYPREHGKQTRIEDAYNQQGPKYKVGRAIAKWWHHTGLPFNATNSPYYKTAIQEVQRGGLYVQPPTARDLARKYLQEEVNEIKSYIDNFKKKWEKYGVTLITSDGKKVEDIVNSSNFWDRVFKLVQIIEPLYEVLRVVGGDRRPSIGLVYAKLEAAKKKICEVSPRHTHLVLDVVEDRWDRQMSRDLHRAAYYLHPAYHYTHELAYEDDLTAAFTRVVERLSRSPVQAADTIDEMKSFREAIRGFAEPSAIAGRERVEGDEEGDRGNVGQPYSPRYEMNPEAEVDLLGDIELEHVERTIGGRVEDMVVLLQMLEVTVVVTMEVEVVTMVREEMVTVVREEEVVRWHSKRSNFFGVQPKILVMVPQCGTIEGRSLDLAVKQEVHQWIPIAMTL
ncbi:hypothetical protein Taro_044134 [Colocasia esculenta]|uniref:Uncharacterized protein n=1 Tax=Colocasia esculenta TaxID=4460 RepID=A0A843WMX8_COLES|nr:hypothetical protein [Colocasia esculenta]